MYDVRNNNVAYKWCKSKESRVEMIMLSDEIDRQWHQYILANCLVFIVMCVCFLLIPYQFTQKRIVLKHQWSVIKGIFCGFGTSSRKGIAILVKLVFYVKRSDVWMEFSALYEQDEIPLLKWRGNNTYDKGSDVLRRISLHQHFFKNCW